MIMEHLNRMRDLSHLRAIHRGAYFVDMKTIEPRRLTGEAWGKALQDDACLVVIVLFLHTMNATRIKKSLVKEKE